MIGFPFGLIFPVIRKTKSMANITPLVVGVPTHCVRSGIGNTSPNDEIYLYSRALLSAAA